MEAMLAIGAEPIIRAIHLDGSGQFFVLYHHGWGEFLSTYNDRRDHRVYFGLRLAPQATWDD